MPSHSTSVALSRCVVGSTAPESRELPTGGHRAAATICVDGQLAGCGHDLGILLQDALTERKMVVGPNAKDAVSLGARRAGQEAWGSARAAQTAAGPVRPSRGRQTDFDAVNDVPVPRLSLSRRPGRPPRTRAPFETTWKNCRAMPTSFIRGLASSACTLAPSPAARG